MLSIIFTMGGMLFFALLISLVNDEISRYTEELQAASSKVIVRDHTLVLGSSSKAQSVLEVFGTDFDSTCKTYVVMADQPFEEPELDNGARVIFRAGDCSDPVDLLKVSPNTARSIVLLSPECDEDSEADAMVMARAMVLMSLEVTAPIITEIRDKDNIAVVREMLMANATSTERQSQVVPVAGDDAVGCLMVQAAFEPGLPQVVHDLLDYAEGDEMEVYVQPIEEFPQLEGKAYSDVIFMFHGAVVLGVLADRVKGSKGCPQTCPLMLNPPDDFVFEKGDKICTVVRNLNSFDVREEPAPHQQFPVVNRSIQHHLPRQDVLLCNWRDDIEDVFREIDKRVGKGSVVTVMSHYTVEQRQEMLEAGGGLSKLKNIQVNHVRGQTVKQSTLRKQVGDRAYDAMIVFSDTVGHGTKTGDARAAVCSLLLRSLLDESKAARQKHVRQQHQQQHSRHGQDTSCHDRIITEIKDRKSLQLLRVTGVSQFIIANELSSMMMVHMACRPELRHFWIDNIFSDKGDNMNIVRVDEYVDCAIPSKVRSMSFWDLLATCRANAATPIAYMKSSSPGKWRWNPEEKSAALGLQADDLLVVVAAAPGVSPCRQASTVNPGRQASAKL